MKISPADFRIAFTMPFDEAVEYLSGKGYTITETWRDMASKAHVKAFTVAGVSRLDTLKTIKKSLTDSLGKGIKLEAWKKTIGQQLRESGSALSPARLENIYRTNTLSAYNAGRTLRQNEVIDKRPYKVVNFVPDSRQSEVCKDLQSELSGVAVHKDHPRFNELTPPFHYQCRATTSTLDAKTVERRGLKVLGNDKPIKWQAAEGFEGSPVEEYEPDLSDRPKKERDMFRRFLTQRRAELDEKLKERGVIV